MHRTSGMNNWTARSGYRYRMSVPGPIEPTRTGWRYPDGTVKPFYKRRSPTVIERRSLWARIVARVAR